MVQSIAQLKQTAFTLTFTVYRPESPVDREETDSNTKALRLKGISIQGPSCFESTAPSTSPLYHFS